MLILTRRIGETLVVGSDSKFTILAVEGNRVRIGIQAPKDVLIDREEIRERKEREKIEKPTLSLKT